MGIGTEIAQRMFRAAEWSLGVDDPVMPEQQPKPGCEGSRFSEWDEMAAEVDLAFAQIVRIVLQVNLADAASTEQAVQEQDQTRIRAQIAADTIALREIYADDFFGIGPTGVVRNKADVIADFTSHALTYQSITTAEVRVRVYGNTAVETGRSMMVGRDRGKAVPRESRFTRVWVMTDGRWQLVANHYSLMTTQSE